ncbi:MAG: Unknown protein [uncultured Campylobacterales bacterium]|uniref:Uncharacterized protein n=1 Tax=uncultured Campylobacterales bacterium TaxID=352960 RepID=A0A6S6SBD2_9BACT|nr:MAG: Unknown protein [uncultured Campylobacterales bacterium]
MKLFSSIPPILSTFVVDKPTQNKSSQTSLNVIKSTQLKILKASKESL